MTSRWFTVEWSYSQIAFQRIKIEWVVSTTGKLRCKAPRWFIRMNWFPAWVSSHKNKWIGNTGKLRCKTPRWFIRMNWFPAWVSTHKDKWIGSTGKLRCKTPRWFIRMNWFPAWVSSHKNKWIGNTGKLRCKTPRWFIRMNLFPAWVSTHKDKWIGNTGKLRCKTPRWFIRMNWFPARVSTHKDKWIGNTGKLRCKTPRWFIRMNWFPARVYLWTWIINGGKFWRVAAPMTLLSLTLEMLIIYWFTISVLDCSSFECGSNTPLAMRVVCTTSHEVQWAVQCVENVRSTLLCVFPISARPRYRCVRMNSPNSDPKHAAPSPLYRPVPQLTRIPSSAAFSERRCLHCSNALFDPSRETGRRGLISFDVQQTTATPSRVQCWQTRIATQLPKRARP